MKLIKYIKTLFTLFFVFIFVFILSSCDDSSKYSIRPAGKEVSKEEIEEALAELSNGIDLENKDFALTVNYTDEIIYSDSSDVDYMSGSLLYDSDKQIIKNYSNDSYEEATIYYQYHND